MRRIYLPFDIQVAKILVGLCGAALLAGWYAWMEAEEADYAKTGREFCAAAMEVWHSMPEAWDDHALIANCPRVPSWYAELTAVRMEASVYPRAPRVKPNPDHLVLADWEVYLASAPSP